MGVEEIEGQTTMYEHIAAPHIDSFNSMLYVPESHDLTSSPQYLASLPKSVNHRGILQRAINDIAPIEFLDGNGQLVSLSVNTYEWDKPHGLFA